MSDTPLHLLTQLRVHLEALQTLGALITHLKSQLTTFKRLTDDELRTRYLAEVISFFPAHILRHLQCRLCLKDKYCWRGQTQGYMCALYFLSQSTHPSIQVRRTRLERATDIQQADFYDLLVLCTLTNANIRLFSRITSHGLRTLLHDIVFTPPSNYVLTSPQEVFIVSTT